MATAPPADISENTVTGIPVSSKSIADVRNAIGEACNTPQSGTVAAHHPRSVTALGMVTEDCPQAEAQPSESPIHSPCSESSDPCDDNDNVDSAGTAETTSVANADIDLCRRAVEPPQIEQDVCSICLDEFTEDDPEAETECGHIFHLQCVMQWAQRSRECPLCFRGLGLKDPTLRELLPFGEYTPPPGVGAQSGMASSIPANIYGLESWELEQLLQRLALANQALGQSGSGRRHRSHRSRRHEGETDEQRAERHRRRREQRERERASGSAAAQTSATNSSTLSDATLMMQGRYPRQASIPDQPQGVDGRISSLRRSGSQGVSGSTRLPGQAGSESTMNAHQNADASNLNQLGAKLRSSFNAMGNRWRSLWRGEDASGPSGT